MALSPLDLQANLGHTHDVARVRHVENEHASLLQHNLDSKSVSDSQRSKDTVVNAKKSEDIPLSVHEDKQQKKNNRERQQKNKDEEDTIKTSQVVNPSLGSHIDVTR